MPGDFNFEQASRSFAKVIPLKRDCSKNSATLCWAYEEKLQSDTQANHQRPRYKQISLYQPQQQLPWLQ